MKIRISDIPPEGRALDFDLDTASLNARVGAVAEKSWGPPYVFEQPTRAELMLHLEGSTVIVSGRAEGSFASPCSRCAEDTKKAVNIPVNIVLKPSQEKNSAQGNDEDISYGFYSGQEVDCSEFTEEFLILALPYLVLCSDKCKGLCPRCGANLNAVTCDCPTEPVGDERFSVLRQLKTAQ